MSIPMHIRALSVACAKAAHRIEAEIRLIEENGKRLAEMGYPDLRVVLAEIEAEERMKAPAPVPKSAETLSEVEHAKAPASPPPGLKPEDVELLKRIAEGSKLFRNSGW